VNAKINIESTKICTERLIMRPWEQGDLTDLFAYASVSGIPEMAGWQHHKNLDDSQKLLDSYVEGKNCFALYHMADKKIVGSMELHNSWAANDPRFSHLTVTELGTALARDYWGLGLAAEAALTAVNYCFTVLGLDAVTVCHFLENFQSHRVIEKCGFSFMQCDIFYSRSMEKEFLERQYILFKEDFHRVQ